MAEIDPNWKSHLDLRILFIVLLIVHLATFTASYFFYNGEIDIGKEALSDCGAFKTTDGDPNTLSMVIFSMGMVICGLISFLVSRSYRDWKGLRYRQRLIRSMRSASIGYALMAIPNDISEVVHCIGMVVVLFSLWYMIKLLLMELKYSISKRRFWSSHILLGGPIIIYMIESAISLGTSSYSQKIAIMGIAVVFFMTLNEFYKNSEYYKKGTRR